jgi:hypothetical protein
MTDQREGHEGQNDQYSQEGRCIFEFILFEKIIGLGHKVCQPAVPPL